MPKVCPICHRAYESEVTSYCPLPHCPNCGNSKTGGFGRAKRLREADIVGIFVAVLSVGLYIIVGSFLSGPFYGLIGVMVSIILSILVAFILFAYYGPYRCHACGAKFFFQKKRITLVEEYIEKRCKICGATMPKDAKFCGKCGSKLS